MVEIIKVKATLGLVTLCGYIKSEFPMKYGNNFTLNYNNEDYWVQNMYEENFEHLIDINIIKKDGDLNCLLAHNQLHIFDERIPEEYYHD